MILIMPMQGAPCLLVPSGHSTMPAAPPHSLSVSLLSITLSLTKTAWQHHTVGIPMLLCIVLKQKYECWVSKHANTRFLI